MARVTVEDCLKKVDNRFALVLLASGRTRQLMKGSKALVEGSKNNEQVQALREIAAGKVFFNENVKKILEKTPSELQTEYEKSIQESKQ